MRLLALPGAVFTDAVREAFERRLAARLPARELKYATEVDGLVELAGRLRPDVLLSGGSTQTLKLLEAAPGRPVVAWGKAEALAGRRLLDVCGFDLPDDVDEVRLRLLQAVVPGLAVVGLLYDDGYPPGTLSLKRTRAAAERLGIRLSVHPARDGDELRGAFAAMREIGAQAVRVLNGRFAGRTESGVVALALEARLPLMSYDWTTRDGGLLSYTPDFLGLAPDFADLVAAVAGGRAAAELGIRPARMKLEVNADTARALDIELPPDLLARAARVYR